jgi:hypothetical protein
MSEPEKPQPTADEKLKAIESKTTFGRYVTDQSKKLIISIAGAVGGFYGFKALENTAFGERMFKMFTKTGSDLNQEGAIPKSFPLIGAIAGFIVSGFFNTYDSWRKREVESRAVDEINNDVARMMDERNQFAETLNRQETVIKGIIEDRQVNAGKPHQDKAVSQDPVMR